MVLAELVAMFMGYINAVISANLYLGAFAAMLMETIFPPIPSEIVLPLIGYFASTSGSGYAAFALVIAASTAGAVLGAVIIYYVSRLLGRALLVKYGRYVLISEGKITMAEKWFEKYGKKAIFLGRMAPAVRELVSVPAGVSKMNFWRFLAYTTAGSLIWNVFLGAIGFYLGETFESLPLSQTVNIASVLILAGIGIVIVLKLRRR